MASVVASPGQFSRGGQPWPVTLSSDFADIGQRAKDSESGEGTGDGETFRNVQPSHLRVDRPVSSSVARGPLTR